MRALKTLLIILLAVAALAGILGMFGPKASHVERKTMIAAPSNVVWDHVSSLRDIDKWSPYHDMDQTTTVTFEGTDGEVGSKSIWDGKESGKGEQEITEVTPGKHLGMGLRISTPIPIEAAAAFDVVPMGDSTSVTWTYDRKNNFFGRIEAVFKDPDITLGPIYSSGLANLKRVCEVDGAKRSKELKARTFRGFVVNTVDLPAKTYVGKRSMVKWDNISAYYGNVFPGATQAILKAQLKMGGHPSGLFYKWDASAKQTDLLAGIPITSISDTVKVEGFSTVTITAGKALTIAYHGAYEKTENAHGAMEDMMKANHMELRDAVIEEFVTDPTQEPDTAKWLTNIYYPIK